MRISIKSQSFLLIIAVAFSRCADLKEVGTFASTSQQIMIGTTAMAAALMSKPNMWMVQALNGSTAPRNKSGMPTTCITLFRGSR